MAEVTVVAPDPDRMVYVHVGTGRTPSVHYCSVCDGFYGVPHSGPFGPHAPGRKHPHGRFGGPTCACRPCQERWGRFPNGGTFVTWKEATDR